MKRFSDIDFPKELPFRVPEGYFEALSEAIKRQTVALKSPSLFELPEDYFQELSQAIRQRTTALPKTTGFTTPETYFEYLPHKIQQKINEPKPAKYAQFAYFNLKMALASLAFLWLATWAWWQLAPTQNQGENITRVETVEPVQFPTYPQELTAPPSAPEEVAQSRPEMPPKPKINQAKPQAEKTLLADLPTENIVEYLSENQDFEEELLIEAFLANEQAAAADLLFSDTLSTQDVLNTLSEEEVEEILLEETL